MGPYCMNINYPIGQTKQNLYHLKPTTSFALLDSSVRLIIGGNSFNRFGTPLLLYHYLIGELLLIVPIL